MGLSLIILQNIKYPNQLKYIDNVVFIVHRELQHYSYLNKIKNNKKSKKQFIQNFRPSLNPNLIILKLGLKDDEYLYPFNKKKYFKNKFLIMTFIMKNLNLCRNVTYWESINEFELSLDAIITIIQTIEKILTYK